jgi:hypothetical protein
VKQHCVRIYQRGAPDLLRYETLPTEIGRASAVKSPASLNLPPATPEALPFKVEIPQAMLVGVPLVRMRALVDYWKGPYDWRRAEQDLNTFPQFRTGIDGLGIHFLHVRSTHANALPIIFTHGWPGTVFEFLKVIGPLTDPTAHGGKAEDAFHVVVPSQPGFGFLPRRRLGCRCHDLDGEAAC